MSERERDSRKNSREPKPSKETYNGKNKTVENKKKLIGVTTIIYKVHTLP
jgi:hypothetical protein